MSKETHQKYDGKDAALVTKVGNKAAKDAAIDCMVGGTVAAMTTAIAAVGDH